MGSINIGSNGLVRLGSNGSMNLYGSPVDIPGCVLWLRSDLGVTKDGSNLVSSWADQSGNSNDAAQDTDTKKPVYHANIINGQPVIRFDGADDYMSLASVLGGSKGHAFYVFQPTAVDSDAYGVVLASIKVGGNNKVTIMPWAGDSPNTGCVGTCTNWPTDGGGVEGYTQLEVGVPYIVMQSNNGTNGWRIRLDGYEENIYVIGEGTNPNEWFGSALDADTTLLGCQYNNAYSWYDAFLQGDLAEVIVYQDVELTVAQISQVETYLMNKYQTIISISDWTDVAGCVLYLESDAIEGLSNNDPIATWADKSGGGHDATQTTENKKPLYITNQINGKPSVRFDGINDDLYADAVAAHFTGNDKPLTAFLVKKIITYVDGTKFYSFGNISSGYYYWYLYMLVNATSEYKYTTPAESKAITYNIATTTAWEIFELSDSGVIGNAYINSRKWVPSDQDSNIGSINLTNFVIGAQMQSDYEGAYGNIDFALILFYDSALTGIQRKSLRYKINDKYKIY